MNPYEPSGQVPDESGSFVLLMEPNKRLTAEQFVRGAVSTVAFFFFGYLFWISMFGGYRWSAVAWVSLSLASIPWAAVSTPWRKSFAISLAMPTGVICLVALAVAYISGIGIEFVARRFNSDGVAVIGLVLFSALGSFVGFYFPWRVACRLLKVQNNR